MTKEVPFTATFLAVKLIDISLVTIYFFILGLSAAKLLDFIFGKFDEDDYQNIPIYRLFFEIVVQLILLGLIAYGLRNLVRMIPFPLDGVAGFSHQRLKELDGGEVLAVVLIVFQKNLYNKVLYFVDKVLGITVIPGEKGKGALRSGKK